MSVEQKNSTVSRVSFSIDISNETKDEKNENSKKDQVKKFYNDLDSKPGNKKIGAPS